jgi:hypothetical protein
MVGRETRVSSLEYIYDTPNNQTILQCSLEMLLFADYSIYELCSEYSVSISPTRQKSMFTLKCYTVAQWLEGKEGLTLAPPPIVTLPPISILPVDALSEIQPYVPSDILGHFSMVPPPDNDGDHVEMINDALAVINDLEFYFHLEHS